MDTELIMSATANVSVDDALVAREYWHAFAPGATADDIRAHVSKTMQQPHSSIKSQYEVGTELRFRVDERLAIAGVVNKGSVQIAFPFVRGGSRVRLEIVGGQTSTSQGLTTARWRNLEVTFFDVFAAAGLVRYEPGRCYELFLNGLALSLRRVEPVDLPIDADGDILPASIGQRAYVRRREEPDQAIFQSPLEADPGQTSYEGRSFLVLPVSLGERGGERLTIDVFLAPEFVRHLGPLRRGDEVAGVFWLQGYQPKS